MEDITRGDEAAQDANFESVLLELESIVETLENDSPPLEEALLAYERGVTLARICMERLQTAEIRIQELGLE